MGDDPGRRKLKLEPREKRTNKQYGKRYRSDNERKQSAFKAPTQGLEDKFFTVGDARDAANFEEVRKEIGGYAGRTFKYCSPEARLAIEQGVAPTFDEPTDPTLSGADPPSIADIKAKRKWELEYDAYLKRQLLWDNEFKQKAFQLVLSHCHPEVKERIENTDAWERVEHDQDVIRLLELIRNVVHKHEEVKQGTMALVEQWIQYYLTFQKESETLSEYLKNRRALADIIDTFGGECGYHPKIHEQHKEALAARANVQVTALSADQIAEAKASAMEEFKAAVFVRLANEKKYGEAKRALDNNNKYLMGEGTAPKTMEDAYRFLLNYKPTVVYKNSRGDRDRDGVEGVALLQAAAKMACYICKGEHPYRDCPKATTEEKKAVTEAIRAGGYKGGKVEVKQGQSHLSVGNDELQECMDGIANVNINEEEASIGTLEGFVDAGQYEDGEEIDGVALIMPTSSGKRDFNCGRDLLWLDSGTTEHTMFATEHLTNIFTSQVTLRQNCNAGYKQFAVGQSPSYKF